MKPATPLPWGTDKDGKRLYAGDAAAYGCVAETASRQNAAYIVAACNAYPQLVEALRDCLRAMGTSEISYEAKRKRTESAMRAASALLANT